MENTAKRGTISLAPKPTSLLIIFLNLPISITESINHFPNTNKNAVNNEFLEPQK